ncbi:hypothetical protein IE077_001731, partial [Cardiosporidium cionae]
MAKSREDALDNSTIFVDSPVHCSCPYCNRKVVTLVEFQTSWLTILLSLIVFLFFGWFTLCMLPFLWSLFQDCVHICPSCLNEIHRRRRISFPKIKRDIVTVRCGSCAVILSRKYVIMLGVMTSLLLFFYGTRKFLKVWKFPTISKGTFIDASWIEYREACGRKNQLGNSLRAEREFETKYLGRTVRWNGKVLLVANAFWTKTFLFIRMDPRQSRFINDPDIAVLFGDELNSVVADILPNDFIEFETTLTSLGRRGQPHFGYLWNVTKIESNSGESAKDDFSSVGSIPAGSDANNDSIAMSDSWEDSSVQFSGRRAAMTDSDTMEAATADSDTMEAVTADSDTMEAATADSDTMEAATADSDTMEAATAD